MTKNRPEIDQITNIGDLSRYSRVDHSRIAISHGCGCAWTRYHGEEPPALGGIDDISKQPQLPDNWELRDKFDNLAEPGLITG